MKYEKLNCSYGKGKKMFLAGIIVGVTLIIIVNLIFSYAKYKVVDSVKLASGTVSYENADFNLIAIKQQDKNEDGSGKTENNAEDGNPVYKDVDDIPTNNYMLNEEKSYCSIKGTNYIGKEKLQEQGITIAYSDGKVNFSGISKKSTKCYLYFDLILKSTPDITLGNLGIDISTVKEGQTTFTGTTCSSDCVDNNSGLFSGTDDYGTTYYYRGTVDNNWVKFANMYWRIIRINGDGTIRLIYSGEGSAAETGKGTSINNDANVQFNDVYNDNKYVGYMYDGYKYVASNQYDEEMSSKVTSSTILDTITIWYETKFNDQKYKDKLDGATGFCGDRTKTSNNHGSSKYTNLGYGNSPTIYGAYDRFLSSSSFSWDNTQEPTFKCNNMKRDLYTTSDDTGKGNGKLPVPVGLITADEVIYAGGLASTSNYGYYLYTSKYYWTMTPSSVNENMYAYVFYVSDAGLLSNGSAVIYTNPSVRPVINLKAGLKFKGTGKSDSPFEITE